MREPTTPVVWALADWEFRERTPTLLRLVGDESTARLLQGGTSKEEDFLSSIEHTLSSRVRVSADEIGRRVDRARALTRDIVDPIARALRGAEAFAGSECSGIAWAGTWAAAYVLPAHVPLARHGAWLWAWGATIGIDPPERVATAIRASAEQLLERLEGVP